jgi:hypothetical protein
MPRWLVLRLSICFLKSSVHRSLHRNLMQSRGVVGRGASRENLSNVSRSLEGLTESKPTVRPHPVQPYSQGSLVDEIRPLLLLLRRLSQYLHPPVRLLFLLLCPPPCSTRHCSRPIVALALWLTIRVSIPPRGRRDRLLCDMPWVRAL